MFPIYNDFGEVVAFSGRILDPKAPGGKYVNSPETPLFSKGNLLFGLHQSKRFIANARQAIVLEGQLDLITTFEAGIQNVVAPQGTALTARHAALLRRFADEVILFFDADAAGQKAAERALEVLFGAGLQVKIGEMPAGEDPDSLIRKSGSDAFRARVESAEDFFDFQINHKLSAAESKTTAGRVAFARKMSQFIGVVPDPVLRDTLDQPVGGSPHDSTRNTAADGPFIVQANAGKNTCGRCCNYHRFRCRVMIWLSFAKPLWLFPIS